MVRCFTIVGALAACEPGVVSAQSMVLRVGGKERIAGAGEPAVSVATPQPAGGITALFHGRMGQREVHVERVVPFDELWKRRDRVAAAWDAAKDAREWAEAERQRRRQEWRERRRKLEQQRAIDEQRAYEARMAAWREAQREAEARAEWARRNDRLYWLESLYAETVYLHDDMNRVHHRPGHVRERHGRHRGHGPSGTFPLATKWGSVTSSRSPLVITIQNGWNGSRLSISRRVSTMSPVYRLSTSVETPRPARQHRAEVDVHALRHSFGTHRRKGGVAPRTAMAAMRHSKLDLTMNVYTARSCWMWPVRSMRYRRSR